MTFTPTNYLGSRDVEALWRPTATLHTASEDPGKIQGLPSRLWCNNTPATPSSALSSPASSEVLKKALGYLYDRYPNITEDDFVHYNWLLLQAEVVDVADAPLLMSIKVPLYIIKRYLEITEKMIKKDSHSAHKEKWDSILSSFLCNAVMLHPDAEVLEFLLRKRSKLTQEMIDLLPKGEFVTDVFGFDDTPQEVKKAMRDHACRTNGVLEKYLPDFYTDEALELIYKATTS